MMFFLKSNFSDSNHYLFFVKNLVETEARLKKGQK